MTFKKYDEEGFGSFMYLVFPSDEAYCISQQLYAEKFLECEEE